MNKQASLTVLNSYNKNTLMETLEIEFIDVGDDFITAKMPVTPKVHQPYGILHGGATAALAESVGSCASAFFLRDFNKIIKGIELSINHVKSKREGYVFATAKAIHKGRTTHLWEVRIVDEDENLISLCKITNIVLDKQ
ncbi:PaaI family thioesterase [Tenacibaculum sp. 1B UA]|uniref:PaaI family thioesterase n=1 Tax=unclassified Tenacibaculum TaxID=2635139 RepID=UPI0026E3E211|nr:MULTISPECIES: PaaI family thioesterase [unclassified Tenacibaculum]MDO6674562.1 PaaI family thioesterase [Tenacibaculum sp. 1_MG-2023]MDX8553784.1 PaaI family thioesterase [Tenacibaculum sp. 1B UA]